jgi:transposase
MPKTIEILTSAERRRRWTNEDKRRLVLETLAPGGSVASVARGRGVSASLLYAWRREVLTGALVEARAPAIGFVPVEIAPAVADEDAIGTTVGSGQIEIVLGNGRRLRVAATIGTEALMRLVTALERP